MQITRNNASSTEVILKIVPSETELLKLKSHVINNLSKNVKVAGFRSGHAPLELIEKQLDKNALSQEFLEEAVNHYYKDAIKAEEIRPVVNPKIEIKKFVPFNSLEIEITCIVLGKIKVADLSKLKIETRKIEVSKKDVDDVIDMLKKRAADKNDVTRPSEEGDQIIIDFVGTDTDGNPINGADGKEYPLLLGSNTFIPGFEQNCLGLKAGDQKKFTLTFPKDYGVAALQGKKVNFNITLKQVLELKESENTDEFAAKVGPFSTFKELKEGFKTQLMDEKAREEERKLETAILEQLVDKSIVELPNILIEDQIYRATEEEKRNLAYRGQTWEDHLKDENMSEQEHAVKKLKPKAEWNLKASFILAEIAADAGLNVSDIELSSRIELLKKQYGTDTQMIKNLNDANYRQDIAGRMLSEKTLAYIKQKV